jgi:phenylalanyl-tRNA synthetase beta chain
MRIHYNYLAHFIHPLPTAEQAAERLTRVGLEVEGIEEIESIKGGLQLVIVGQVLDVQPHPDAERLRVTHVNVGQELPLQIVCGAPNVAAGQKVLVALVGSTLYPQGGDEALKIKKSKIRGVESHGMICAEDELGIGQSHDGILVLSEEAIVGTPAAEYLHLGTITSLEIGLTPNRTDAMSHYGVARELMAASGEELKSNSFLQKIPHLPKLGQGDFQLTIDPETQIKRYSLIQLDINPQCVTPDWMKTSLQAIGVKSIHPVVDITNWVQHEMGQPLHAFDAAQMGKLIHVRNAKPQEELVTLDGTTRKCNEIDVVICDHHELPACLAGVMGGKDSGVKSSTQSIYLECALFDAVRVRKSARAHGIHSDSSFRFERGVDPEMYEAAKSRAVALLIEICEGQPKAMQEVQLVAFERPHIIFHPSKAHQIIGKKIDADTMHNILHQLEFGIERKNDDSWIISVPGCRSDVTREIDVIEEILRVYGFDNVEPSAQVSFTWGTAFQAQHHRKNQLAEMLCSMGLTEIQSLSLTKTKYHSDQAGVIEILNPLSQDLGVMRPELIHSGLEAVALNINHKNNNLALFEMGNVYHKSDKGFEEQLMLGIWLSGQTENTNAFGTSSSIGYRHIRFFAEQLMKRLGQNLTNGLALSHAHYSEVVQYTFKKLTLTLGKVSASLLQQHDIKQPVYYLELNLNEFLSLMNKTKTANVSIAKFPSVRRDLALLLDENVTFQSIVQAAFGAEKKLLKDAFLFDIYQGEKLPQGKKSYAVGFVLQDNAATLTDVQIEGAMERITNGVCEPLGASIRS